MTLEINEVRSAYKLFIDSCRAPDGYFRLTPRADSSSYALCFAIFGYFLLHEFTQIDKHKEEWDYLLRLGLYKVRKERGAITELSKDKPYLQLLVFTLSALSILKTLKHDPLPDLITPLIPRDLTRALRDARALEGIPRSGNQSMFLGIILLHARDYLGLDTSSKINCWVDLHLGAINQFGFWGKSRTMSHLQFQNGYHQYELFEYLQADSVPWDLAANSVASLVDGYGHFAPYPGGGACYDYDAIFIVSATTYSIEKHKEVLYRTMNSIFVEQNEDGGFCESRYIRPLSIKNLSRSVEHLLAVSGHARLERFRYALTLLRPANNRIHTHWSKYSREWSESNLWDSWFRMLTLARIECGFNSDRAVNWGFINYPGIGFHPSLLNH
jgi:hypothetical protein